MFSFSPSFRSWHLFYNVNVNWICLPFQLCDHAQKWANHLAVMNEFYYHSAKNLGQNLFCCPCSALVTDLTGKKWTTVHIYWPRNHSVIPLLSLLFIIRYYCVSKLKCINILWTMCCVLIGQEVASYWYSTVKRYNYFKDIGLLHTNVNAGHFTQMVWVKTKYFGIGKATSKTGKIFVVAYYYPAGIYAFIKIDNRI